MHDVLELNSADHFSVLSVRFAARELLCQVCDAQKQAKVEKNDKYRSANFVAPLWLYKLGHKGSGHEGDCIKLYYTTLLLTCF